MKRLSVVMGLCALAAVSSAHAQFHGKDSASAPVQSTTCYFTSGPRSGAVVDLAPTGATPAAVGSTCSDGQGSAGVIVAPYLSN